MTKLSVNVNKIALLRNQRNSGIPSVAQAATTCIRTGAAGITVHPRPDERHITKQDVHDLAALLRDHKDVEYNIEGNPFHGHYMELVTTVAPTQATLVPDDPGQRTSDHGWNMGRDGHRLKPIIEKLREQGTRVSVFMDPDPEQIAQVPVSGADRIELYTEDYAKAYRSGSADAEVERYRKAADTAGQLGLGLNAGHDLNLKNLGPFCHRVPGILEVSIGHELIADALWLGLEQAVSVYGQVLAEC